MHIRKANQKCACIYTGRSVHFHPIPFTRPSFSIFWGSGSETNEGWGGHKLMSLSQLHYFGKSWKSSWNLNQRPEHYSQMLLPLSHLDWTLALTTFKTAWRNIWSSLVLLNAPFLATLTICQEVWKADKLCKKPLAYFGSNFLSPSQYIISICYPLSFIYVK